MLVLCISHLKAVGVQDARVTSKDGGGGGVPLSATYFGCQR